MWAALPVELQRHCLQSLDVATLKAVRLVNSTISTLATELLFSTVHLQASEASAEKYATVLQDHALRPLVRTLILTTSEPPSAGAEEAHYEDYLDDAIRTVARFSNLREVWVRFDAECAGESEQWDFWEKEVVETRWFREHVLLALFSGLDDPSSPLDKFDTLTLENLQDSTGDSVYESPHFARVLAKVKKLHLMIVTESDDAHPENNIHKRGCHKMFNTDLTERWLHPVKDQLTHLTLYADMFWGFWPYCDLRRIRFPALRSLSLGTWPIVHEWQVDWILAHAATLEELLLHDCPVITVLKLEEEQAAAHFPGLEPVYVSETDDWKLYIKEINIRWHHILPRLSTGLPKLKHFALGRGAWSEECVFEERYALTPWLREDRYLMFDIEFGPIHWLEGKRKWDPETGKQGVRQYDFWTGKERQARMFPECEQEDSEALEGLLSVVRERGRGSASL